MQIRTTVLLLGVLAVLLVVLFGRLPGDAQWVTDLSNAAHGPAFMLVAFALLSLASDSKRLGKSLFAKYFVAITLAVLLGIIVEILQHLTGRDAELRDLWQDTLGAVAAAGAFSLIDPHVNRSPRRQALRRAGFLSAMVACTLMLAPLARTAAAYVHRDRSFPTLFDFGSPLGTYFLDVHQPILIEREALPADLPGVRRGTVGLHVRLADPDEWWRIYLREAYSDWRDYERLVIDLANPTGTPFLLRLRVRDRYQMGVLHAGYSTEIEIEAYSRQSFGVALELMATSEGMRRVDTSMVNSIDLSRNSANKGTEFYVMRVWLE